MSIGLERSLSPDQPPCRKIKRLLSRETVAALVVHQQQETVPSRDVHWNRIELDGSLIVTAWGYFSKEFQVEHWEVALVLGTVGET